MCFGAWPTYHGDFDLKGTAKAEITINPTLRWRFNAGGDVFETPVSNGKYIFFVAQKGRVLAVDLRGEKVWEKRLFRTNETGQEMALRVDAPLVYTEGLVLAGTTRGTLYALDAESGVEQWRYETGGVIVGSPNGIGPENIVVLDQRAGVLHCIDVKSGKQRWKTEGVDRCDGAPGVGNGRIVFGSCLAALHVYAFDGSHQKNIDVGGESQIAGGVAIDGNYAFAGLRDGGLICVDLSQGETVWSSDESDEQTFSTPAVTDQHVVYSSDDGRVYCVNRESGKLIWTFDTEGALPGSPVIVGNRVVVSGDGVLYLLNLANGKKQWSKEVSDEVTAPSIIAGMIVVGADDGAVSMFESAPFESH